MSNMSYCMFHNTNIDMQDCLNAFSEIDDAASEREWVMAHGSDEDKAEFEENYGTEIGLSDSEARAAVRMFEAVLGFAQDMGWCENVDYDEIEKSIAIRTA